MPVLTWVTMAWRAVKPVLLWAGAMVWTPLRTARVNFEPSSRGGHCGAHRPVPPCASGTAPPPVTRQAPERTPCRTPPPGPAADSSPPPPPPPPRAPSPSPAPRPRRCRAAGRSADRFGVLRRRWRDLMLGTGFDPAADPYAADLRRTGELARTYRAAMRPGPTALWPDAPFDPPAGITRSYARLHTMAQAYRQPGTGLTGDTGLATDTLAGLDHLHQRIYHPGTTRYGNWWEWQIGSPRLLLDTLTLLYDEAPTRLGQHLAAVDHFVPDAMLGDYTGTSTGANRVDLCRVVALRGVLGASPAKTALARDALSPVFPHVTRGDGLHADGSFLQHTWVAYSGTYGQVLLDGIGRLLTLLRGSDWEITDPARQIVYDSVERAYAP
ncbi:hypothetical protein ACFQ2B_37885 [Streptomyces stramineus]